ncbi:hypothetical protein K456DRAFT_1922477 [Colletotrichum gloeosporioides 23]|nr:hypothetical protein K456DRAFT_1922477 [Colletotrichum gloeosporioides 23]
MPSAMNAVIDNLKKNVNEAKTMAANMDCLIQRVPCPARHLRAMLSDELTRAVDWLSKCSDALQEARPKIERLLMADYVRQTLAWPQELTNLRETLTATNEESKARQCETIGRLKREILRLRDEAAKTEDRQKATGVEQMKRILREDAAKAKTEARQEAIEVEQMRRQLQEQAQQHTREIDHRRGKVATDDCHDESYVAALEDTAMAIYKLREQVGQLVPGPEQGVAKYARGDETAAHKEARPAKKHRAANPTLPGSSEWREVIGDVVDLLSSFDVEAVQSCNYGVDDAIQEVLSCLILDRCRASLRVLVDGEGETEWYCMTRIRDYGFGPLAICDDCNLFQCIHLRRQADGIICIEQG